MFSKDEDTLHRMRDRFEHCYAFDAFEACPLSISDQRYDLITQFGTFGLAPDEETYVNCFSEPVRHLKS